MKRTPATVDLTFTLNELEVLLLIFHPREKQDLGPFATSARAKLNTARAVLVKDVEGQTLFQ